MIRKTILYGIVFFLIFLALYNSNVLAQDDEIALYNYEGKPVAYIAIDEDYTLYLWDGKPVAYLHDKLNQIHIYAFKGDHLGWLEDGIIIDHDGNAVGFIEGALNLSTQSEPIKGIKQLKPLKGIKEIPPIKPLFSDKWSKTPLQFFLES